MKRVKEYITFLIIWFLAWVSGYEKVSGELAETKATIRSEVRTGQAAQEIIRFADETKTRLLAISTHGHSGIRRWISGSVAYKVLQAGHTPLLLVRAPEVKA